MPKYVLANHKLKVFVKLKIVSKNSKLKAIGLLEFRRFQW